MKLGEMVICWAMFSTEMTQRKATDLCVSARILGNLGNGLLSQ